MTTWLLTGATGTVGSAIARRLAARQEHVRALVRDPERARTLLPPGVEPVPGDVTDAGSVARAMQDVDNVVHTAGIPEQWQRDPSIFERVNTGGTRTVVEAALRQGVQCFLHTSTIDVLVEIARVVVELRGRGRVPRVMPRAGARATAAVGEVVARLTRRAPLVAQGELHFVTAHLVPSSRRAREELGWKPLPLRDGMQRTLDDMARRGVI